MSKCIKNHFTSASQFTEQRFLPIAVIVRSRSFVAPDEHIRNIWIEIKIEIEIEINQLTFLPGAELAVSKKYPK